METQIDTSSSRRRAHANTCPGRIRTSIKRELDGAQFLPLHTDSSCHVDSSWPRINKRALTADRARAAPHERGGERMSIWELSAALTAQPTLQPDDAPLHAAPETAAQTLEVPSEDKLDTEAVITAATPSPCLQAPCDEWPQVISGRVSSPALELPLPAEAYKGVVSGERLPWCPALGDGPAHGDDRDSPAQFAPDTPGQMEDIFDLLHLGGGVDDDLDDEQLDAECEAALSELTSMAELDGSATGKIGGELGGGDFTEVIFEASELAEMLGSSAFGEIESPRTQVLDSGHHPALGETAPSRESERRCLALASSPPAPVALLPQHAPRPVAPPRNTLERKEWTALEDELIMQGVGKYGKQWRRISATLSGRSDDSVRNRWNRLQGRPESATPEGTTGVTGPGDEAEQKAELTPRLERRRSNSAEFLGEGRSERQVWTNEEDAIIFSSVSEFGHRWNRIEQRLPGRTGHAIRNRWQRLLHMAAEAGQCWRRGLEVG